MRVLFLLLLTSPPLLLLLLLVVVVVSVKGKGKVHLRASGKGPERE